MNARMAAAAVVCLLALTKVSTAQPRVDPRNMFERVIAIVPLIGSGTPEDPKRPMYTPAPSEINPASRTGIIAFTWVPTDDGHRAIVEFVARDRASLRQILNDRGVQSFLKGNGKRADVEAALKVHKKDFDINKFGVHAR